MKGDFPVDSGPADTDRRFSVEHRLRSSARSVQEEIQPPTPWYRGRIGRDVAIVILVVATAVIVLPSADVANADYPEARAVADRLDSAWRAILAGADAQETAESAGLILTTFDLDGRSLMILTDAEPTSTGVCYAMEFGSGFLSEAGVLREPASGCLVQSPDSLESQGSWSEVLPSERITQPWFIPVMVLLAAVGLYALVDFSIVLGVRRESGVSRGRAA